MKRRETKKNIRKEERYLTQTVFDYLDAPESQRGTEEFGPRLFLCFSLTMLLSERLQTHSTWNSKERWLDGISDPRIELTGETLRITGQMIWGLRRDLGGEQWGEAFSAVVRFSRNNRRRVTYRLSFGQAGELYQFPTDNDLVRTAPEIYKD